MNTDCCYLSIHQPISIFSNPSQPVRCSPTYSTTILWCEYSDNYSIQVGIYHTFWSHSALICLLRYLFIYFTRLPRHSCFPQTALIGPCSRGGVCFLWSRNWHFTLNNLDELQPCVICGRENWQGDRFFSNTFAFRYQYYFTKTPFSFCLHVALNIRTNGRSKEL